MAYGSELILGFIGQEAIKATGLFMVDWDRREVKFNHPVTLKHPEIVNQRLEVAHQLALEDMGFKQITKKNGSISAITPLGEREFYPFKLELHFDPDEMGETEDSAVVGVAISGRYFPTFADWKDEHGSLYLIVFDREMKKCMEIAQKRISEELPIFANAVYIVKEKHY